MKAQTFLLFGSSTGSKMTVRLVRIFSIPRSTLDTIPTTNLTFFKSNNDSSNSNDVDVSSKLETLKGGMVAATVWQNSILFHRERKSFQFLTRENVS